MRDLLIFEFIFYENQMITTNAQTWKRKPNR